MVRKFDVVLFDLGSTLLYFDGVFPAVMAQADLCLFQSLVGLGYLLDPNVFIPTFRTGLQEYFHQRDVDFIEHTVETVLRITLAGAGYPNIPPEHTRAALRQMYAVTQTYWKREDDALPALAVLSRQGYRLGLISNAADADDVRTILQQHQLAAWFEQVLVSAEVGYRKPHPHIFQRALDFFAVSPDRVVMVGDKLGADVLGAQNAGLASVWITRRSYRTDNLAHEDTIRPDASIDSLEELPALLESWK
jgi:HAD superfamily hydrolase (TIGR01662 family)